MESWENKTIADKLNSLEDLPDGYTPNIASKWEIIQSGLEGKTAHSKRRWYVGIAFISLLFIGGMMYFSRQPDAIQQTQIIEAAKVQEPFTETVPSVELKEQTPTLTVKQPVTIPRTKRQQLKIEKLKPHRQVTPPIQPTSLPIDTVIKLRIDTAKASAPIADLKTSKPKKKVFQKDFEGFVSTADSSHHKTAKGFQIQWQPSRDKGATSEQPRIRLTQNF